MVIMIVGDPYQFSVVAKRVDAWNEETTEFNNGVLLLCVGGEFFPKRIVTATLSRELPLLKESLENIAVNEELFCLPKERAFCRIYHMTFPNDIEVDNDFRYDITPDSLSDESCFVFAVRKSDAVRFLAAHLIYDFAESRHELKNLAVSEAFVSEAELHRIVVNFAKILL